MTDNLDPYWSRLAYGRMTLKACAEEPIQFCGAIQDVGWFFMLDHAGKIIALSENWGGERPIAGCLGSDFGELFSLVDGSAILLHEVIEESKKGTVSLKCKQSGREYYSGLFQQESSICVDLEPKVTHEESVSLGYMQTLQGLVTRLEIEAKTQDDLVSIAAKKIRMLTGFERVMMYRFEPNGDGLVVAEDVDPQYDSFLGLRYPASDIPPQARSLYLESRFRMIADVEALPVRIVTHKGLAPSDINLQCSAYRAVSPFHIQYLKNMGVKASFSLPIKVRGDLWGLIACHQYTGSKFLPRELRSSCELATQVITGKISAESTERRLKVKADMLFLANEIVNRVAEGSSVVNAFEVAKESLLQCTASSGFFVKMGTDELSVGHVPDRSYLALFQEKLFHKSHLSLWHSEDVKQDLDLPHEERAVGAMAVPLSLGFNDLIVWFRPESLREVRWGGDPRKKLTSADLNPRKSFDLWVENIAGKSLKWTEEQQESAQHLLFTFMRGIFEKAAELSRMNDELASVSRAKDEFISQVSHELRTPLGVIMGWIDILRDELRPNSASADALNIISRNAKLQINLINDLLDVSRILSGKMRLSFQDEVSLNEIVTQVVSDLEPTAASKSIHVNMLNTSTVVARVDPERFRQIVWNLLSNAVKFTQKGGAVTVEIKANNSSYEVIVSDNGIGIVGPDLPYVFDRFKQVKVGGYRADGLGLGLSIVKSLVELHGGRIFAKSAGKNLGSTFVATFPIFSLKNEIPAESTPTLSRPTNMSDELKSFRILVLEDQPEAALAMSIVLTRMGADVEVANDGKTGISLIRQQSFDLILSDIQMPEMDGYEFIKRWRDIEKERRSQPIPAIALTAHASSKDRTECLTAGFNNHIPKPIDRLELLAVIQALGIGNRHAR